MFYYKTINIVGLFFVENSDDKYNAERIWQVGQRRRWPGWTWLWIAWSVFDRRRSHPRAPVWLYRDKVRHTHARENWILQPCYPPNILTLTPNLLWFLKIAYRDDMSNIFTNFRRGQMQSDPSESKTVYGRNNLSGCVGISHLMQDSVDFVYRRGHPDLCCRLCRRFSEILFTCPNILTNFSRVQMQSDPPPHKILGHADQCAPCTRRQ